MKKFYAANEYWEDYRDYEEKANDNLGSALDRVFKDLYEIFFGTIRMIFGGKR